MQNVLGLQFQVTLELKDRPEMVVAPFRDWDGSPQRIPGWWSAHNLAKHRLNEETFRHANILNALHALGGLYIVLNDRETRQTHPVGTHVFRPIW